MRDRHLCLSVFVKLGIGIDIVDAALIEQSLPAPVLTLDGYHRSGDLVSGQVRDRTHDVRKVREKVGHSAALIVDQEKAHVVRAEVDRQ